MDYEMVLVTREGRVGVVTLNRPQALNALNSQLIDEIAHALAVFDADPNIGCMVLTGSEKAFAAGADIKEMAPKSYPDTYLDDLITPWDRIGQKRKPLIAAVAGFALGGGCEVAMMCDFIIAADNAKFGQPEIKLGVMPGGGGDTTPDPLCRQSQGHGYVLDRTDDGCARGRARRPCFADCAVGFLDGRDHESGTGDCRNVDADCHDDQGKRQPLL